MQAITLRKPIRATTYFILLAVLLLALNIGLTFALQDNEQVRLVIMDLMSPAINLLCTAALIVAAVNSAKFSRRMSTAWGVIAAAQLVYTLGDIAWSVIEVGFGEAPFPSSADWFYLAYYPLLLTGILLLPGQKTGAFAWIKKGLDMGIAMVSAILLFWNFLIGPLIQAGAEEPMLTQVLSMAYPVGDLLLMFALLVLLYNRPSFADTTPIALLTIGTLNMVATDSIFSYQSLMGTYVSGSLLDVGWIVGYLFTGLAGVWVAFNPYAGGTKPAKTSEDLNEEATWRGLHTYFPYLWAAGAIALLVIARQFPLAMSFSAIVTGVGAVIVLIIARQIIAFLEHKQLLNHLNQALETVQQQAVELKETNDRLQIEIIERKKAEEQLSFDALHDGLTGLPNRALFLDRLGHALEYLKRRTDLRFSVLFLDLDYFKVINDSLGHPAGDQLLISVAKRLKTCMRATDTVARLGGDEFVILLDNIQDEAVLMSIINRIQEHLRQPHNFGGHEAYISTSIGVVPNILGYQKPDDILRDADIALYQAKDTGKARFVVFDESLRNQAMIRLELENDLRRAMNNQELRLCYQPIYQLDRKKGQHMTGFEALLRWEHPQRGILLPADFLHMAEETGLIIPIGQWVLTEACSQLKVWHEQFPADRALTMNVNISGIQFAKPDFVDQIEQVLWATGVRADCLKLEITESLLIENKHSASEIFRRLREIGVQFQIDDFGTGYSSLSYLQRYPVHTIKIDKSFIDEMKTGGKGAELIRTIVQMAKELGMDTIAEGVETEEQLQSLRNLRCDYVQGFKLSQPVDSAAITSLLKG